MANELQISSSLQVQQGSQNYRSLPLSFTANQTTQGGPVPGMISAVTTGTGTTVSFAPLVTPALVRIMNLDATNFVTVGLVVSAAFQPLMELLPGESYVFRLSRTAAALWVKANVGACKVLIEGFET